MAAMFEHKHNRNTPQRTVVWNTSCMYPMRKINAYILLNIFKLELRNMDKGVKSMDPLHHEQFPL